ncbi:MAG: uncharacterized protein KVP18_001332 [Porospora cf. gigantea A]|uniref:uncharacterized protein n=1 Tax=Porospora cf. gigantea A TaxID=2853593 RepID=UPI00355A8466|nr:MAG: hypothetical protein KVP18_001332 [Porospora cf. gigantea A]
MKAIILVGGYGTRLRPFTFSKPKPLVPFCNLPIVEHQVRALADAGVDHVIFAVAYKAEELQAEIERMQERYGICITCCKEDKPLGTAGPIKNAESLLMESECDDFFVCNSDVTCDFPLSQMLRFHRSHGREGTILTTKVDEPQHYGVICTDLQNCVESFVEKPQQFVGDDINAGVYVLNRSVLDRIELKPTSIERAVFPEMARDKALFTFPLRGFWADLGRPRDLIQGMKHKLASEAHRGMLEECQRVGVRFLGHCLVDPSATIAPGCVIGPDVVLGPCVDVKAACRIQSSLVFAGATVGAGSFVRNSVVGWNCTLAGWNNVECVLGEDVRLGQGVVLRDTTVLPHKVVDSDDSGSILL